jgi:hypothetical protein
MFGFTIIFLMHLAAGIIVPAIIFFVKGIKAGGNRRLIAIIIAVSIACIILASGIKFVYDINHVIGTYNGHESDEIVIDGVTYAENYDNDYSASDKGHYLGSVVYIDQDNQQKDPKFVWDVKGTDEYIYVLFAYDGTIYKRVD